MTTNSLQPLAIEETAAQMEARHRREAMWLVALAFVAWGCAGLAAYLR